MKGQRGKETGGEEEEREGEKMMRKGEKVMRTERKRKGEAQKRLGKSESEKIRILPRRAKSSPIITSEPTRPHTHAPAHTQTQTHTDKRRKGNPHQIYPKCCQP